MTYQEIVEQGKKYSGMKFTANTLIFHGWNKSQLIKKLAADGHITKTGGMVRGKVEWVLV